MAPEARPPNRVPPLARELGSGYDARSLVAVAALLAAGSVVGIRWYELVDPRTIGDPLLLGIWISMGLLLAWRVEPRRDLLMIAVGLGGGTAIEWWGTHAGVWSYFTGERPPPWILPAWPAATLAIDRMATLVALLGGRCERALGRDLGERAHRLAYFVIVPVFVLGMTSFLWPHREPIPSRLVVLTMVIVASYTPNPRRDVALFFAGSAMGLALEYWGTSRQCWTYYTQEVPPPVAVLAHGFAAVAFSRVAGMVEPVLARFAGVARPAPG